jgi:mono/diheme cytochrome c family protein
VSLRVPHLLLLALLGTLAPACNDEGYEPPGEEHRLELADSLYSPALFDTISWESNQERVVHGNLVYADFCRRCHGAVGEGGPATVAGREIVVPSLVDAEWHLGDDMEAARRRIFAGHTGGMPSWGISRLTPREIDAVAYYLLEQLRPEMLSPQAPDLPGS